MKMFMSPFTCSMPQHLSYNFSFTMQHYSIFMLLNDAVLSTHEWHFRAGLGVLSVATLDK